MIRPVRHTVFALTLLLTAMACGPGDSPDAPASAEMDHSQHQMGVGGAVDSTGAVAREPVMLTASQERALGVTYTQVSRSALETTVRTVGQIEASEENLAEVTPKVDGFVERLFVATTGEPVRRGQALLTLYSPELVSVQEELLTAIRLRDRFEPGAGPARQNADRMVEAARRRLSWWDISDAQVERLVASGTITKTLTLVSPVGGIVLDKSVVEGQKVSAGQPLYRVADLSEVWVEGDVFEKDIRFVTEGAMAHIEVDAYPGRHYMGTVSFVYPVVDRGSRTNRVRVRLTNPDLDLKPGMFATIFFDVRIDDDAVVVPTEAVVVTGVRNLVFVREPNGMLRPQEVVLGPSAGGRVEILEGLTPGEEIVASANFLVDAESRLAATGGGMPGMQHGAHEVPPEHQHD